MVTPVVVRHQLISFLKELGAEQVEIDDIDIKLFIGDDDDAATAQVALGLWH